MQAEKRSSEGGRTPTTVFRYKRKHSLNAIFEPESIAIIGVCTHPRLQRDHPDCGACVIPRLARYQMCPGISQKFDQVKQQFRYRCTIHRVKVADPFVQCKALRNCPLDVEELAS